MEVINYKKRDIIPLTQEEINFYNEQETCHICEDKFGEDEDDKDYINRKKVKNHCHYTGKLTGAAHSKCNLYYKVQKEIPLKIPNPGCDTHFVMNQLTIEFDREINCIGDNMEKYITFSVPIKKELNNGKTVTYKLKFIDSYRFMDSLLLDLVDNTSEIFKSEECISCKERKKINSECSFAGVKNDKLIYKCKQCKKECKRPTTELKEQFPGIYQFFNGDLKKFVLLLRKGVYHYEYMDSWEIFDEDTLPPKKDLYSNFNLGHISDKDYEHAKKV